MTRTLKTIMHHGKLALEYKKDGNTVSIQETNRPLLYIAAELNVLEDEVQNITSVNVTIEYR